MIEALYCLISIDIKLKLLSVYPCILADMAKCHGNCTLTTRVDRDMRELVDEEAEERAIPRAEFIRRVLDVYDASRCGNLTCPNCGTTADLGSVV